VGNSIAARATKPLIGISTGFTDYGDYIGVAFSRPLVAAGALPVLLPYPERLGEAEAVLGAVEGLVLAVGRDLEPGRYGETPHPSMTPHSPLRDRAELALAEAALARETPVLGICRGLQVLNVARGGTLYRDRTEYPEGARDHPGGDWQLWEEVCRHTLGLGPPVAHPSHSIAVAPGSILADALGPEAEVNSYHHQAIRELGEDVRAVAVAPDGIVEAIEVDGAGFALGVQWELQESWQDDRRFLEIFSALVDAAREARRAATIREARTASR
jgi:putative glutamine amidotransferase